MLTEKVENRTLQLQLQGQPDLRLTLKELAKASDVSERTIRYYIQEGVLLPPYGAGPASRYGLEHLARLSLVRRFKSALLPLSQIKQLLQELSAEELEAVVEHFHDELSKPPVVVEMLEETKPRVATSVAPKPATDLTLENILQERAFRPPHQFDGGDIQVFTPPSDTELQSAQKTLSEDNLAEHREKTAREGVLSFGGRWNRINLAPGLEIQYQEGGPQDTTEGRERLAELVELAMRLYK